MDKGNVVTQRQSNSKLLVEQDFKTVILYIFLGLIVLIFALCHRYIYSFQEFKM